LVHPQLFAKRTVELIRADFATYIGNLNSHHHCQE